MELLKKALESHGGLLDRDAMIEAGFNPSLGKAEYDRLIVTVYRLNLQIMSTNRKLTRVGAGSLKTGDFPVYKVIDLE